MLWRWKRERRCTPPGPGRTQRLRGDPSEDVIGDDARAQRQVPINDREERLDGLLDRRNTVRRITPATCAIEQPASDKVPAHPGSRRRSETRVDSVVFPEPGAPVTTRARGGAPPHDHVPAAHPMCPHRRRWGRPGAQPPAAIMGRFSSVSSRWQLTSSSTALAAHGGCGGYTLSVVQLSFGPSPMVR